MRISSAFPSKYLKAADLQGRNARVVIDHVDMEDIGDEDKPVLYFQGKQKGMVLNKTNATNISVAYGDDTDDWPGKEIILFPAMVDFQGRSVEAIRCRAPRAADNPPRQQREPSRDDITSGPQPVRASQREQLDDEIPF